MASSLLCKLRARPAVRCTERILKINPVATDKATCSKWLSFPTERGAGLKFEMKTWITSTPLLFSLDNLIDEFC